MANFVLLDRGDMSEHSQSTPEVSPCHSPFHESDQGPSQAPSMPLVNAPWPSPSHTPPGDAGHAHNLQQDLDLPDPGGELGDPISEDELRDELIENDQEEGELTEEVLSDISDGALDESGELEDGEVSGASSVTGSPVKYRPARNGFHRYNTRTDVFNGARGHGRGERQRRRVFRSPSPRTESEVTLSESEDEVREVLGRPDIITDSPASPEPVPADEVAVSPRIIPVGDVEYEVEELDDDIDEDILYLRLIALRSMQQEEEEAGKAKADGKGNCSGGDLYKDVSDDLTNEMQELICEAEEARSNEMQELICEAEEARAAGNKTPEKVAAAHEVITIEDDDDDKLSKMKIQLNESFMTLKRKNSKVLTKQWSVSPQYSPTQSPEVYSPDASPKYVPGPVYSPIIEEIDLSSPVPSPPHSPLPPLPPERPPLPDYPPLPPYQYSPNKPPVPPTPVSLIPPPPPPVAIPQPPPRFQPPCFPSMPQLPLPVFASGEPLPPGEDCVPDKDVPPLGPPPRGPLEPQDMDLDSGNEAESKFFKDQRRQMMNYPQPDPTDDLFPSSVWGFGRNTFNDQFERRRSRGDYESQEEYYYGRGGFDKRGPKPDPRTLRKERNRRRNERKRKQSQRSSDFHENERMPKRKRRITEKGSENKIIHKISAEDDVVKEPDEDEEELRALLLKQVGNKKKETTTNDKPVDSEGAEIENNNKENEISNEIEVIKEQEVEVEKDKENLEAVKAVTSTAISSMNNVPPELNTCVPTAPPQNCSILPLPPFAQANNSSPPAAKKQSPNHLNQKSTLPALKKSASTLLTSKKITSTPPAFKKTKGDKTKPLPVGEKPKTTDVKRAKAAVVKKLSSFDKQRSFPNLHKKIVIPLNADSDSEEEQENSQTGGLDPVKNLGLNLDAFLKEARKTSVVPLHKTGFKSNILSNGSILRSHTMKRKIPPGLKLNIKAAQRLTPAAKQTLMSSNVSHLPKDKQKEYLQLKELIAKKEKIKKAKTAGQQKITSVKLNQKEKSITSTKDKEVKVDGVSNDNSKKVQGTLNDTHQKVQGALKDTSKNMQGTTVNDSSKKGSIEDDEDENALRLKLLETMKKTLQKKAEALDAQKKDKTESSTEATVTADDSRINHKSSDSPKPPADPRRVPARTVLMSEKTEVSNEVLPKTNSQRNSPHKAGAGSPQKNKSPSKGEGRDFSRSFSNDFTVKISGEKRNVETKKEERPRNRQVIPRRKSSSERSKTSSVEKSDRSKARALSPEEKLPLLPGVTEEEAKTLNSTEQNVIELRRTMESSLFKLSAYMSQLKNENIGVESVQEYAKELRKQLAETEKLLLTRQNKVENLRNVIRKSREEVTNCRQNLIAKEDECKSLGKVVHGPKYNTPSVGADNISRKLAQIASTAQKVKTHSEELEDDTKEEMPVKSDTQDVDLRPGLIGAEFSSSLAHLKANPGANLDPHLELCRFELAGRCSDDSCIYQHHFK